MVDTPREQVADFGAGCFWGVQETFDALPGVTQTVVGYEGGDKPDPTYEHVCGGDTGHAETVQITYDPTRITYEELLTVFWENHDPTTMDRQGPDVGTQYRSVVFYRTDEQRQVAERMKAELAQEGTWSDPIVTQIVPAKVFYPAEDYHQNYFDKQRGGTK